MQLSTEPLPREIHDETTYLRVVRRIEEIGVAAPGSADSEELELLTQLARKFESPLPPEP
jgi:hypothetical protein